MKKKDIVKKRRRRKGDKVVESKHYYLYHRRKGQLDAVWTSMETTNKEYATRKAIELLNEWEAEDAGVLPPKSLRNAAKAPLEQHLRMYLADLEKRGKTGRNNKSLVQTRNRITRLCKENGWIRVADVTPGSLIQWRNQVAEMAPRTLNHYLSDMVTFLNWMKRTGLIPFNPLEDVQKVEVAGRQKRERRALSDEELLRLCKVAPSYRSIPYYTAAKTGLRHAELRDLKWGDVMLDKVRPYILVRASISKNKKQSHIPLTKCLEQLLKNYRPEDAMQSHPVFPKGVPRARTLQKDLEMAGIPYQDEQGRYAYFHSLRYTWATYLQKNGVNARATMELMRHSDRKLTDKVYTDPNLLSLAETVRELPDDVMWTEKGTETSVPSSQFVPDRVASEEELQHAVNPELDSPRCELSHPVRDRKMVEVAGVEPASR